MRFKKLELLGFKSFAEATELLFEPGITAVVGPNGSGKSNIADGIKWVLGEQSARELRGGRMEDLIFNGSDHREPISYAEVSLTLDNSDKRLPIDYAEVTISRRLFRSGESEYLLNRTSVRLKDITDLLSGTGIGTSSYSLFEQGRIEQVINSHPEERRVIFEEAAGITKFKAQKREATRRLDETEANLARVSDVIAEVRRQIQALERQVKRAKAYQEQFEELKRLEIRLARHEEGKLALQRREKEAALEGLRGEMAGFEERFQLKEADLEKGREAAAQADSSFAQARELLLGVKHSQETVQHRIEVTHERIEEGKKRSLQLQEELSGAKEEVRRLRAQHEELNTLLQASGAQRQAKEEEVRRLSEGLERCAAVISGAGEAIARAQGELLSATTLQVQVKNDLNKILQENNRLEARHNRLKNEATKVGAERAEALRQVEELEGRVRAASGALESAGKERTALKEEMDADEAVLSLAREKLSGVDQEITKAASQLELLMGLISSHEGYASGVKALLTAFDQGALSREGVSGVLAELIQVDPKETVAVEASLGSWAQAVVVESDEAADRCRAYLETSRGGRVLFLIVGRVPSDLSGLLSAAASFDGAVPLINRMGITPHLEPLLKLLLADTWLVSGRMPARQFLEQAREKQPAARFVTPAGELFTLAGALLGSAPVEEGLVVGRRSRLQSLEIGLSRLEKSREEARGRVSQLESELKAKEERLQKMEEIFQQHRHELQRLDATFGLAKEGLEKLDQERALLAAEESEAEEELRGLGAQRSRLESDLSEKEGGLSLLQETIQGSQEEISRAAKQREEISVSLATARSELGSFDEILSSRVSSLAVLEQTLNRSTAKISTCQEEIAGLEGSFKEWEKGAEELSASLEGLRREEAVFQERVAEAQARREELLQAAGAKEKELLSFSRAMEQFQSKLHAHEMELAQLSFQREEMRNRLAQVYQVNLEEAPGELNPFSGEAEAASARDQTAELSRRLSRIGPVNLASIDEERELQSRYEYLSTQQNDLLKAKENLHEAITKINRTTRAMFRETFQAIQKEFQVTFKQLFGGGEARLVLMDEEDVLESGVEIIARPPGKPLQAISLLSGGEKALTTIALLFAIFRIKPSPFCLLDEIDAPLDEANVGRFASALREFLKDSQFIIITHNKKTITMADVMYGITMEESGVSKIVSVKFKQDSNGDGNGNGHGAEVRVRPSAVEDPKPPHPPKAE